MCVGVSVDGFDTVNCLFLFYLLTRPVTLAADDDDDNYILKAMR